MSQHRPGGTPLLAAAGGAAAAVTIVLYQAWFMPFFQPFFAGREAFARVVFYALYGALVLLSAAAFATRADLRRAVMPVAVAAVAGLAATALHPIGLVNRAYIIAVAMGGATIVLMLVSAARTVLQLTAAVTALNASLCFVDLLFANGFTSTVGRAAGLAINPNVAAAGILLGAAASHRAVPRRLQPSFLVLMAGSLAVTLSRSTIAAAVAAVAVPAAVEIWQRVRGRRPPWTRPEGVRPAVILAIGLVGWVALAMVTNQRFRPAVQATVAASLSSADALQQAQQSVAVVARDTPSASANGTGGSTPVTGSVVPRESPAAPVAGALGQSDAARIAALDARLSGEGGRNTISARTLFLERALLVYRNNGFFGMGLEAAHPLVPHNTFVLFALAFGHLGWLIPLGVVALTLYAARDVRDLPLGVAVVGTMATSHDILLTPSLFLPIAIGIGGMLALQPASRGEPRVQRSIAFGAAAGVVLFVVGCLVIVGVSAPLTVEPLRPQAIVEYRRAYMAALPTQTFAGVFVPAGGTGPGETVTFLRDDSRPLTRVSWRPGVSPAVAAGEYAVHDDLLVFSPADRRDPRTSGHVLEVGLPRKVGPPFYALLTTLAAWCTGVILLFGRTSRLGRSAGGAQAPSGIRTHS